MKVHTIPGIGMSSNSFLVTSGREAVLVDAGWDSSGEFVLASVGRLLGGAKLKALVLTHRHVDHVGGAAAVVRAHECEVVMHEKDADSIIRGDMISTGAAMFGGEVEPLKVRKLADGDAVVGMKVLHTPGHTIGSMCLYDGKAKILISGDTVFKDGVGRWDLPTGDGRALRESVAKLAALRVEGLFPGHGDPVERNGASCIAANLGCLEALGGF